MCDPSEAREGSGEDPLPSRIQAYYMKRDMFISHTRGDFITSPEISQGEACEGGEDDEPTQAYYLDSPHSDNYYPSQMKLPVMMSSQSPKKRRLKEGVAGENKPRGVKPRRLW